jgi:hypothetical protein
LDTPSLPTSCRSAARRSQRRRSGAYPSSAAIRSSETILARVAAFHAIARIGGAHHERLDGKGYPRGLTAITRSSAEKQAGSKAVPTSWRMMPSAFGIGIAAR